MLQFNNKEVAEHFESLVETDRPVHKAGVYSGSLSNITPAMAQAMVSQQSNLLQAKAPIVVQQLQQAGAESNKELSSSKALKPAATEGK